MKLVNIVIKNNKTKGTRNILSQHFPFESGGQTRPDPANAIKCTTLQIKDVAINRMSRWGDNPATTDLAGYLKTLKQKQLNTNQRGKCNSRGKFPVSLGVNK